MQNEPALTPMRVDWEPAHASGDAAIDAQHRALLEACNALAGFCAPDDERFEPALLQLKAQVREHFVTEAEGLAEAGAELLEDLQAEFDEFGYVADEIATTDNFDRVELQRFAAVWCLGHVTASAQQLRALRGV